MNQILHKIGIACKPQDVFTALTTDKGLASWWTSTTAGAGEKDSIIEFSFNDTKLYFEVIELVENSLVRWKHKGTMPEEWIGSEIAFKLTPKGEQTFVFFSHSNWKESSEFMGHCSTKWAVFLLSLKQALETGKGNPFPDDIQIDHNE